MSAERHAAAYDACVDDFVRRNGDIPPPVAAVDGGRARWLTLIATRGDPSRGAIGSP